MKRTTVLGAGVAAVLISVLGYGCWFGISHGSLYVDVSDVSDREHSRPVTPLTLTLLSGEGRTLAEAHASDPIGTVFLSSPAAYASQDVDHRAPFSVEARREWDQCFARQSRWIPTWIRRVKYLDFRSGSCAVDHIPVSVSEHPDTWWLWWVPLRHIGGRPYTSFNISVGIDISRCTAEG